MTTSGATQNTSPSSDTCHVSRGTLVTRHVEITPVSPPPNETILPWLIGDQLENLIPDKNHSGQKKFIMSHMGYIF